MKKTLLFVTVALATIFSAAAQLMSPDKKLRYAENIIERFYVDTVNSDKLTEEAIVAMLKTLDPHSLYSNAEETRELTEPLEGNFSGIGIQFNMTTDTLYIIQTVAGGPSEKVGILAGDRILEANDTLISGVKMKNSDIMKRLRGPKGTRVKVKVLRKGVEEPIIFNITRDDIPIYSVDAAYMASPEVGYIRVNKFAETTTREMIEAIDKLQKKGMKHLIIDLMDNGGGFLNAATSMADMVLDPGKMLVFTRGDKVPYSEYRAEHESLLAPNSRVVVMVNQYSASASEILSGAVQDNDRGVIVGRRTFGKGLVQRPFMFPDGSMIRLTVARYYTPSGRCIQKPYDSGQDDYSNDIIHRIKSGELSSADSIHVDLSQKFSTLTNNRTIYGGGGIIPDVFVPIDTTYYSVYYRDLLAKGAINRLCIDYVDQNRKALKKAYKNEDSFIDGFEVTDDILNQLRTIGEREGVEFNEEQFNTSLPWIRTVIKAIIGRDLFDQSTYFRIANPMSPEFREALEVITDADRYNSLLRP